MWVLYEGHCMKRFLIIFGLLFIGLNAYADEMDYPQDVSMTNFWQRNGKSVQKVMEVGTKILNENKLDKRIPFKVKQTNSINACAYFSPKQVVIYSGILPYIDNDDELAYILGHEMTHSLDAYGGPAKWVSMSFNTRSFEYKADLRGIDLMANAGYNPIAALTQMNKWMPEATFDFPWTHPKSSKRMFEMYKYIYKKYPWALTSDMTKNVSYQNFLNSSQKEINQFIQEEKLKERQRKEKYSL